MKEFQALGLDISIINDEGETLQLKEIEEAEDRDDFNSTIEEVESPAAPIEENNEEESEEDYEEEFDDDLDDLEFDGEFEDEGDEF